MDQPELRQGSGDAGTSSITRNTTQNRGPPGIRTPNLRIKSLVEECWSEACEDADLRFCVSRHPIASHRFPFLHGDETGTETAAPLPSRWAVRSESPGASGDPLRRSGPTLLERSSARPGPFLSR